MTHRHRTAGFTLVELAVVLFVLALLTGGVATSITGYLENKFYADTREDLARIGKALTGHSLRHQGRLPYADANGDGLSDSGQLRGTVPWKSLGLTRSDAFDAWQKPIRYHVDGRFTPLGLPSALAVADLDGNPVTAPDTVAAVLFSSGENHVADGDNGDGDGLYTSDGPVEGGFDDEVSWIPVALLEQAWAGAPDVLTDAQRVALTRRNMAAVEEALVGYALLHAGRLPTADTSGDGLSDSGALQGEVPWRTLGLDRDLGLDGWGGVLRYHVDAAWREGSVSPLPDTTSGLTVVDGQGNTLTAPDPSAPVAVLVSFGRDGTADGDNGDADVLYTRDTIVTGAFDDVVTWVSRHTLLGPLASAGVWP